MASVRAQVGTVGGVWPLTLIIVLLLQCNTSPSVRNDLVERALTFRPEGTEEIVYATDPERLCLLAYPTGGENPVGAVIFIHGGGWSIPGPDMPLFADWVDELNKRNLRSFSIEHRVSPAYRGIDPIEDSIQAFRFIQSRSSEFGFPPDKIAIMGFSSGGHIAVMTGLKLTSESETSSNPDGRPNPGRSDAYPPVAVVSFYAPMEPGELYQVGSPGIKSILEGYLPDPPKNMTDAVQHRAFLQQKFPEISPGAQLHRGAPPMLLIHGQQDRLVPATQSISFYWKARNLGLNKTQLILVPRGDHNFNRSRSQWARLTEQQALDFIARSIQ